MNFIMGAGGRKHLAVSMLLETSETHPLSLGAFVSHLSQDKLGSLWILAVLWRPSDRTSWVRILCGATFPLIKVFWSEDMLSVCTTCSLALILFWTLWSFHIQSGIKNDYVCIFDASGKEGVAEQASLLPKMDIARPPVFLLPTVAHEKRSTSCAQALPETFLWAVSKKQKSIDRYQH